MKTAPYPKLDDFLSSDIREVRKAAPASMIYAPAGTRRAAILAGLPDQGDEFAQWTQTQLFQAVDLIFEHGVRHLLMPMLGPSQFSEVTPEYHEHLWRWFDWGLSGPEAIAVYQEKGWRVRMAFSDFIPRIQESGKRLVDLTASGDAPTLWCIAVPEYHLPYQWMLAAAQKAGTTDPTQAVAALYGDPVPPARLYLGSGKPVLSTLQLPPLLVVDVVQSYWSQRPGYSLDEIQLRTIFHDYAFLRKTWLKDKSNRAEQALANRDAWELGPTIGVGTRLGPFWYPGPISSAAENTP